MTEWLLGISTEKATSHMYQQESRSEEEDENLEILPRLGLYSSSHKIAMCSEDALEPGCYTIWCTWCQGMGLGWIRMDHP